MKRLQRSTGMRFKETWELMKTVQNAICVKQG